MRKNLKEARQKAGMTQKQIAEYLGMTERAYQQIEAGDYYKEEFLLSYVKLRFESIL